MAFRGVTFSGQNVTPKNDGALYNAHYGDGILEGCSMAISGDDLVVQSGHIIACGRVCQVDGATPVDLSGRTLQTGYIQVVLNYDISQGEGQQWFPTFVESATTTFPALTQDDINTPSGTLYQLGLAVVQISGGNLTDITSVVINSPLFSKGGIRVQSDNGILRINDANDDYQAVFGSVDDNYAYIGKRDSTGSIISSMRFYEGGSTGIGIASKGKDIVFRPNGHSDSNGQMYLDTDGQLHGGHPRRTNSASGRSVAANTTTLICSVQVLKGGLYQIYVNGDFNPSASGTGQVQYGVGYAGPQSRSTIDSKYMAGGAHIYCMSSCVAQLAANDYIYFNINAPVNGTVSGGISAVLIN